MVWLVLIVLVLLALAVIAIKMKQSEGQSVGYPYSRKQALFTQAERSFLGVLDQAIGEDYRPFGKVRVADVVEPQRGLGKSKRQMAFNRISAKHFDFVLCSKSDLSVVCAIELDDQSHQQRKRQDRDAFLVGLCQSIAIPLVQVAAQRAYSVPELRAKVLGTMGQQLKPASDPASVQNAPDPADPAIEPDAVLGREVDQPQAVAEPAAPVCPKCGAPMVRRQVKAGGNAGQGFWGCSSFPKCRGVIQGTHQQAH